MVVQTTTLALGYIGIRFLLPMMLLTTADATERDLLSHPVSGAHQLASLILSVFVLLGLAYTHHMKGRVPVPPLPFWHVVTLGGFFMFLEFFFEFVDHARRFTA